MGVDLHSNPFVDACTCQKLTCLCNMIWLVLVNCWEYYYFRNYYKKNVSLQCHAITTKLYSRSDPLLLPNL